MIKRLIFLTFISSIFLLASQSNSQAQNTSNQILLLFPTENSIIKNQTDIIWEMSFNSEATYEIRLYKNLCLSSENELYGVINSKKITSEEKSENNIYNFRWDLSKSLQNASNIEDGKYCLSISSNIDSNFEKTYESFTDIEIRSQLDNSPIIMTRDVRSIFKLGEGIEIDVDAIDNDSEKINFEFLTAPNFLTIDTTSGVITSKDTTKEVGSFVVHVLAKDEKGNSDSLVFNLNIVDALSSLNDETISLSTESIPVFFSKDDKFSLKQQNGANFTRINLFYSLDGQSFINYFLGSMSDTIPLPNIDLKSGKLYLRINLTDQENRLFGKVIEVYKLERRDNSRLIPSIYDLVPANDSNVSENPPNIIGKFSLVTQNTSPQVSLFLNDNEITDFCSIENGEFECKLTSQLSEGAHKLRIIVIDENLINTKEIVFNILTSPDTESSSNNSSVINIGGNEFSQGALFLVIITLCLFVILIIVPWTIFSMWLRGGKRNPKPYHQPSIRQSVNNQPKQVAQVVDPYKIGDNKVTDQPEITQGNSEEVFSTPVFQPIITPTLPTSYTNDEIPDWLKDVDEGSNPVGQQGQVLEQQKPIKGDQPFGMDNYGAGDDY